MLTSYENFPIKISSSYPHRPKSWGLSRAYRLKEGEVGCQREGMMSSRVRVTSKAAVSPQRLQRHRNEEVQSARAGKWAHEFDF